MAKTFEFNGKTYNFAEDIQVPEEGLFEETLVDENNHRCEMLFRNGKLFRLTELDQFNIWRFFRLKTALVQEMMIFQTKAVIFFV